MVPDQQLSPADAAVLETFAVPRYLGSYGELVLDMLLCGDSIRLAHLGCRTGFPDLAVADRVPTAQIIGIDPSRAAIELARNKAVAMGKAIEYHVGPAYPTTLEAGNFSHALSIHPAAGTRERIALFSEMARLLYTGGQSVIALPLRGSFLEIEDLLREYAVKHDREDFLEALEDAGTTRPTVESLAEELEISGLDDVDVEVRSVNLDFESGRGVREDPATRLLIVPEVIASFPKGTDLTEPLAYVWAALERYWSEGPFELTVNIGCASARRI